jgi:hypothetical protein
MTDPQIKAAFYDISNGFRPLTVYRALQKHHPSVLLSDVKRVISEQEVHQRFKPAGAPSKHNWFPLTSNGPWNTCAMDLADLKNYSTVHNSHFRYAFCLVDRYTKFLMVIPTKSKSKEELLAALQTCFEQIYSLGFNGPSSISCDEESAWAKGAIFKNWVASKHCTLNYIRPKSINGKGDIESAIKTFRMLCERMRIALHTDRWVQHLAQLLHAYNSSVHSATQVTPIAAQSLGRNEKLETKWRKQTERASGESRLLPGIKLVVGQRVRIKIQRKQFEKGTLPTWSETIHTIVQVNNNSSFQVSGRVRPYRRDEIQLYSAHSTKPIVEEPAEPEGLEGKYDDEDEKKQPPVPLPVPHHDEAAQSRYIKRKKVARQLAVEGVLVDNVRRSNRERAPRFELLSSRGERIVS